MDAIATLPIFAKLVGRKAIVAGGSLPAVWKVELLAAAGAQVTVYATAPCPELLALAARLGPHAADVVQRDWTPDDFAGARIAIAALEGGEATRFRDAARHAGVPVNVIDVPELCDFQFGTIVSRSPLMIGISTDGAAPVFGQVLRTRIEAILPAAVAAWATAAKAWRPALQAKNLAFEPRRRFWEVFAERALAAGDREPGPDDETACMDAALETADVPRGRLCLVGTGPGPSDLVTLRAVRVLQSADLMISHLATLPAILDLGRREARRRRSCDHSDAGIALAAATVTSGGTAAWCGPGDPVSCTAWNGLRRAFQAAIPDLEVIEGIRCPTCPKGCAVALDRTSGMETAPTSP